MRYNHVLPASLIFFITVCTAWPWPPSWQPQHAEQREVAPEADKRQASTTKFNLSFSGTQGNTATTKKQTSTKKNGNNSNGGSQSITASASLPASSSAVSTGKGKGKTTGKGGKSTGKNSGKITNTATTKTFNPELPAGGVSMITPAVINGPQYYRIGTTASQDYVTFAWNYTSLKATPTAVNILASCATNSATYTIAMNQSVTGHTQAITWDTGKYQETATIPLLVATYTLIIYNADSAVTAMPQAGYLGTFDQYTFGMYTPQPYTPIEDYVCATCNGAMSSMVTHTLGFMLGMCIVTVLSFSWFTGVAGLW